MNEIDLAKCEIVANAICGGIKDTYKGDVIRSANKHYYKITLMTNYYVKVDCYIYLNDLFHCYNSEFYYKVKLQEIIRFFQKEILKKFKRVCD